MIAILGATGYIGSSLARVMAAGGGRDLVLFARDPSRVTIPQGPVRIDVRALESFSAQSFSLVINAIGAGDPARVAAMGAGILDVTARWDDAVLSTMAPDTRYVFLSSGAIYGAKFDAPATAGSELALQINRLRDTPAYTIAKLYAEYRHRLLGERAILDLRIFAYADRAIRHDGSFFLSELARCVAERRVFTTSADDMVRDYAGADELLALINCWENESAPNTALDLYTLGPVSKLALLDQLRQRFGLAIEFTEQSTTSPTGSKRNYFSQFRAAETLGYRPGRDAMKVVMEALEGLIKEQR